MMIPLRISLIRHYFLGDGGIGVGGIYLPLNRFPWFWQDFESTYLFMQCLCSSDQPPAVPPAVPPSVQLQSWWKCSRAFARWSVLTQPFWSPKIVQNLLSTTTSVSRVLVKKVHDCHIIYFSNLLSALLRFNSQLFTSFSFIFAWWSVFEFSVWEILWFRTFSKHIFSFFLSKNLVSWLVDPPTPPTYPPSEIRT